MCVYRIARLPGDGIGPEVVEQAWRVLRAAEAVEGGFHLEADSLPAGAAAYLSDGDPLPAGTLAGCRAADAILLGAMGLPHVRYPDGTELVPQITLRTELDLYAGLRPIKGFAGTPSSSPRMARRRTSRGKGSQTRWPPSCPPRSCSAGWRSGTGMPRRPAQPSASKTPWRGAWRPATCAVRIWAAHCPRARSATARAR